MITLISCNDLENIVDVKLFSTDSESLKKTINTTIFHSVVDTVNQRCTDVVEDTIGRVLAPLHLLENELKKKYKNRVVE